MRWVKGLGAALIACWVTSVASAQGLECGTTFGIVDDIEVVPADRAGRVALDAPVVVRYQPETDLPALLEQLVEQPDEICGAEPICLFRDASRDGGLVREKVAGKVRQRDERTLVFEPDEAMEPTNRYFPLIARAGFDGAARIEFEFVTGMSVDREAPRFDPPDEELKLALDTPPKGCNAPSGSVRVALFVPRARDDGDEGSVEISLHLSVAAGLKEPQLRARERNPDSDEEAGEVLLSFLLSPREATQRVCVELSATDGVGRRSEDMPGLCFEPALGSVFTPSCSAPSPKLAFPRAGMTRTFLALSAPAALLFYRRRRRFPRHT